MARHDLRPAIKQALQDRWIEFLTGLDIVADSEHKQGEWYRVRMTNGPEKGNVVAISNAHGGWRSHVTDNTGDCFELIKLSKGIRFNEVVNLVASKLNLAVPSIAKVASVQVQSNTPTPEGLWTTSLTSDGTPVQLTNFKAEIVADITYDNGNETRRAFEIKANVDGENVGFEVTPGDFESGRWILERLGPKARVLPTGQRVMPFVIDAVQAASNAIERRTVFEHIGWRKVDQKMVYLHAGGHIGGQQGVPHGALIAVTPEDEIIAIHDDNVVASLPTAQVPRETRVSHIEVMPPSTLRVFDLPEPPEVDSVDVVRQYIKNMVCTNSKDLSPGVTMLAATARAPLGSANFGIHVDGPTGSRKTSWVLTAQQAFAPLADEARLPANWHSTSNAIMATLAALRDTVCVVDNYIPAGDRRGQSQSENKARAVIQSVGDGMGRARCRQDGTLRPRQDPGALLISTGEDTPSGESTQARLMVIRVGIDTIDPVDLGRLQRFAESGQSAVAMASYIQWLAPRIEALQAAHRRRISELRQSFGHDRFTHGRTATIVAELAWGLEVFTNFAYDIGAIPRSSNMCGMMTDQLLRQAGRHQRAMTRSDPAHVFLDCLDSVMASGKGHLVSLKGGRSDDATKWGWREYECDADGNTRWKPLGQQMGWISKNEVFLDPRTSFRLAQEAAGIDGDRLDVTPTMLNKSLDRNQFLSRKDVARQTYPIQKMLDGRRQSVLAIRRTEFMERQRRIEPLTEQRLQDLLHLDV